MDFMAHFTIGTGGHYITMLPTDWSSHDLLRLAVATVKRCYGIHIFLSISFICKHSFIVARGFQVVYIYILQLGVFANSCSLTNSNYKHLYLGVSLFKHSLIFVSHQKPTLLISVVYILFCPVF